MPPTQSTALNVQRRTQAERRDESERLLVEATLDVVAEKGVDAATFNEIAQQAGYSRGLASHRFGSKRGLTEAVIAYLHHKQESALESDQVADMPAFDAIAYFIEHQLHGVDREHGGRAYFMLLSSAVANATSMRDLFASSHERVRRWLREVLQRGKEDGSIRADIDPDGAALMIGSMMLGVSMQRLVDPATDLDLVRTTIVEALRHVLCAKSRRK